LAALAPALPLGKADRKLPKIELFVWLPARQELEIIDPDVEDLTRIDREINRVKLARVHGGRARIAPAGRLLKPCEQHTQLRKSFPEDWKPFPV